jgi:site-specific DNA recombinase
MGTSVRTAVIYARLSDVRKGDTEGIERQLREAEAHAERLGLEVVDRLVDNDLSAADRRKQRPAFRRLMAGIEANEWDTVVLRSLDRWVRRPAELEEIIGTIETSKVAVEAIHGEIDLRTRHGRMAARLLTAVAIGEVEAVTERVTDWHADRAARGLPHVGTAAYGFKADKLTIEDTEAALIREGAARVLEGEPLSAITRGWNEAGRLFRLYRRPDADSDAVLVEVPWLPQKLRRVLLSPRTAGLREHRGTIVADASWPAIVDREMWERVVRLLTNPARRTTPVDRRQRLLTGIATCGSCGATLNAKTVTKRQRADGSTPKREARYYCRHCFAVLVAADRLDEFVAGVLFQDVDSDRLRDSIEHHQNEDATADLIDTVAKLERELTEVAADAGAGLLSVAEWRSFKAAAEPRLVALREELARTRFDTTLSAWAGRGEALRDRWYAADGFTLPEKRAIVSASFETLSVGRARPGFNRFDAGRVEFELR